MSETVESCDFSVGDRVVWNEDEADAYRINTNGGEPVKLGWMLWRGDKGKIVKVDPPFGEVVFELHPSDRVLCRLDSGGGIVMDQEEKEPEPIDTFTGEYHFLSNFYERTIIMPYGVFKTAEHAYQAIKTEDLEERQKIKEAKTPGDAKKLGKKCTLRKDWDDCRVEFMHQIVKNKFTQNKDLKEYLLKTEDRELIEGNLWHDNFWGNCLCDRCKEHLGDNRLGEILMDIREELRLT